MSIVIKSVLFYPHLAPYIVTYVGDRKMLKRDVGILKVDGCFLSESNRPGIAAFEEVM